MPNLVNFEIVFGQELTLEVTVQDANGTAIDITGATLTWTMVLHPGATAKITKTTTSGITLTDPTNGRADIALAETDTDTLDVDSYYYHDLKMVSGGATTYPLRGYVRPISSGS